MERWARMAVSQGLFELAEVPYAGCSVVGSAVAMNKYICKKYLESHRIPVLPSFLAERPEGGAAISKLREEVTKTPGLDSFPLFIKPVHLGSSVGVGKADDNASLDAALAQRFPIRHTSACRALCGRHNGNKRLGDGYG